MVKLNSKHIREIVRNKGMTLEGLAWLVGVSCQRMKRELDKGTMDALHAKRIADTLNVPIVEITLSN